MQKVILDLLPGGVAPIVYASQYDDERSIRFMLTEGGPDSQYSLNGNETITAELTKPDGTEATINVTNPGAGKNYVDLVNGSDDYDQAGVYLGEIVLTRNATVIGSANFVLKVEEDAYSGQITTLTATGNPCNFETDISDALVSLTANIVCGGGGGTPDNPIPIVGHSELNLTRCGINFVSGKLENINIESTGEIKGGQSFNGFYAYVVAGKTYTITTSDVNIVYAFYEDLPEVGDYSYDNSRIVRTLDQNTFTAPISGWVLFRSNDLSFTNAQLELGSTATEYEAYNGQTFTVAFGQTVYGGVYDKSGRLTITHGFYTFTGNETEYIQQTNRVAVGTNIQAKSGGALCSHFTNTLTGSTRFVYIPTDMAAEDLRTFMQGNTVTLVYELATPIVIDVPSISPSAVVGTNNIVSDCGGDVDVTYIKKV